MMRPSSGELGDGAMGEIAGFEGCRAETLEIVEVAEVCDATLGEEVRPWGELRESRARGVKPVPESESSWGREVSVWVSIVRIVKGIGRAYPSFRAPVHHRFLGACMGFRRRMDCLASPLWSQ